MKHYTFKRMQELAGIKSQQILKESIEINDLNLDDDYISADDLSGNLESNSEEVYDFGGGEI
jgi:hypothetical protein